MGWVLKWSETYLPCCILFSDEAKYAESADAEELGSDIEDKQLHSKTEKQLSTAHRRKYVKRESMYQSLMFENLLQCRKRNNNYNRMICFNNTDFMQ